MSASGWKRARLGRRIDPVDARPLVERTPEIRDLHQTLESEGFRLTPKARAYLTKRQTVTVTFVWRQRVEGITVTFTWKASYGLEANYAYA